MEAYVGADWSATKVECVCGVVGTQPRSIRGCGPCLDEVRGLLQRVRARHQVDVVHVVVEAGSPVWPKLFCAAGAVVHVIDAKQAERFRASRCSSGAKDDDRDAAGLWYQGQSPGHRPEPWIASDPLVEGFQSIGAAHERLVQRQTRAIQQLRSLLGQHMPLVVGSMRKLNREWCLRFLEQFPTPWHLGRLSQESFEASLRGSKSHGKTRAALWTAVSRTEAPWMSETLATIVAVEVRALIAVIRSTRQAIRDLERQLRELANNDERSRAVDAIPGVGLILVAAILGLAGDRVGGDRDAMAIRMGASPVFVGSGKTRGGQPKGRVRMRKSAPPVGRHMSYLLGRMAAWHTAWGRAMYADAMRRAQKPSTAYRRIARSMLRIVNAMLRDGTAYDETAYIRALQARGVPWAVGLDVPAGAAA